MNVVWTENSELALNEIIDYVEIFFGLLVAQDCYFDVISVVHSISSKPEIFSIHQLKTQVRKAIINKKAIFYYKTFSDSLYLLGFYDTRKETHKF